MCHGPSFFMCSIPKCTLQKKTENFKKSSDRYLKKWPFFSIYYEETIPPIKPDLVGMLLFVA